MPASHHSAIIAGPEPVTTAHVAMYPLHSTSVQVILRHWRKFVIAFTSSSRTESSNELPAALGQRKQLKRSAKASAATTLDRTPTKCTPICAICHIFGTA